MPHAPWEVQLDFAIRIIISRYYRVDSVKVLKEEPRAYPS